MKVTSIDFSDAVQTQTSVQTQESGAMTVFDDVNPTNLVSTTKSSVSTLRDFKDDTEGGSNFIKRVKPITTFTWAAADPVGVRTELFPLAWIANSTITLEKIKYFALAKIKLRLRVVTNGTPFHYGRLAFFYIPMKSALNGFRQLAYFNTGTLYQNQYLEVNPTTSTPQEMLIDVVVPTEMLTMTSPKLIGLKNAASIVVYTVTPLNSANTATPDPITVQVYAWAEDIILSVPTPNSNTVEGPSEAIGKGPISSVASSVANAASYLKDVPIIGRFAQATTIGANAVSAIATLFGFSNPVLLNRYEMVKLQTATNYCHTTGRDSSKKLTMDPLNELSIDPKPATSSSDDQMSYAFLYKVPLYFRTIPWSTTQASGTVLAVIPVTPCGTVPLGAVLPIRHVVAPLQALALCAKSWSGPLKFRFQVICSAYHKGRIQFRYIPSRFGGTTTPGFGENNSQTAILDIGIHGEKEIIVGWSQGAFWIPTHTNASGPVDYTVNSNSATSNAVNLNGEIVVEVLTELTAPEATSDIEIHCFIEGHEDLLFSDYTNWNATYNYTVEGPADKSTDLYASNSNSVTFGGPTRTPDTLTKFMVGEQIASLRALFKRTFPVGTNTNQVSSVVTGTVSYRQAFPLRRAPPRAASNEKVCNNNMVTIFDLFKNAFLGEKGAVRYKVLRHHFGPGVLNSAVVSRALGNLGKDTVALAPSIVAWSVANETNLTSSRFHGWANYDPSEQLVEFEVPDYRPSLFDLCDPETSNFQTALTNPKLVDAGDCAILNEVYTSFNNTAANTYVHSVFMSTGEDYNLIKFIGMPILVQAGAYSVPPLPPGSYLR